MNISENIKTYKIFSPDFGNGGHADFILKNFSEQKKSGQSFSKYDFCFSLLKEKIFLTGKKKKGNFSATKLTPYYYISSITPIVISPPSSTTSPPSPLQGGEGRCSSAKFLTRFDGVRYETKKLTPYYIYVKNTRNRKSLFFTFGKINNFIDKIKPAFIKNISAFIKSDFAKAEIPYIIYTKKLSRIKPGKAFFNLILAKAKTILAFAKLALASAKHTLASAKHTLASAKLSLALVTPVLALAKHTLALVKPPLAKAKITLALAATALALIKHTLALTTTTLAQANIDFAKAKLCLTIRKIKLTNCKTNIMASAKLALAKAKLSLAEAICPYTGFFILIKNDYK